MPAASDINKYVKTLDNDFKKAYGVYGSAIFDSGLNELMWKEFESPGFVTRICRDLVRNASESGHPYTSIQQIIDDCSASLAEKFSDQSGSLPSTSYDVLIRADLDAAYDAYGEAIFDPEGSESMWAEFNSSPRMVSVCRKCLSSHRYNKVDALAADAISMYRTVLENNRSENTIKSNEKAILANDLKNAFEAHGTHMFDFSKNESMWGEFISSEEVIAVCKDVLKKSKAKSIDDKLIDQIMDALKLSRELKAAKARAAASNYTRFEKARIVGARALQIAMGAPVLVDYPEDMLDPIDIALLEFDSGMIPISVVRS